MTFIFRIAGLDQLYADYRSDQSQERGEVLIKRLDRLQRDVQKHASPALYEALGIAPAVKDDQAALVLHNIDGTDAWYLTEDRHGYGYILHGPDGFTHIAAFDPDENGVFFDAIAAYEKYAAEIARRRKQLERKAAHPEEVVKQGDFVVITFRRDDHDVDAIRGYLKWFGPEWIVIDPLVAEPVLIHPSQVRTLTRTEPRSDLT